MITRGYLERCNNPPVRNFISWVSPQGGQYGVPKLGNWTSLDYLFDCCAYDTGIQETLAFAGYWIDPYSYDEFVEYSEFLADIDNLRDEKNQTYKNNILALDNFVMGYSLVDIVLQFIS